MHITVKVLITDSECEAVRETAIVVPTKANAAEIAHFVGRLVEPQVEVAIFELKLALAEERRRKEAQP
jgi:hypothetical protein